MEKDDEANPDYIATKISKSSCDTFTEETLAMDQWWHWIPNPVVPGSKILGGFKVNQGQLSLSSFQDWLNE